MIGSIVSFFANHATKTLGFLQVTLGAIAGATEIIPTKHLKYYVFALGLLTAWRGFFNSSQQAKE